MPKLADTPFIMTLKVESGKLVLEEAEFDLGRELEGLVDMFSVQCINHNVETILDLSGTSKAFNLKLPCCILLIWIEI